MKTTKIHISCCVGDNRRPSGGWAIFSDGKGYDWMIHPIDGDMIFFADRGPRGYKTFVSFRSPKRAAALSEALGL
jgi:hypothetical protein